MLPCVVHAHGGLKRAFWVCGVRTRHCSRITRHPPFSCGGVGEAVSRIMTRNLPRRLAFRVMSTYKEVPHHPRVLCTQGGPGEDFIRRYFVSLWLHPRVWRGSPGPVSYEISELGKIGIIPIFTREKSECFLFLPGKYRTESLVLLDTSLRCTTVRNGTKQF